MARDGKSDSQPVRLDWVEHHTDTELSFHSLTYTKVVIRLSCNAAAEKRMAVSA